MKVSWRTKWINVFPFRSCWRLLMVWTSCISTMRPRPQKNTTTARASAARGRTTPSQREYRVFNAPRGATHGNKGETAPVSYNKFCSALPGVAVILILFLKKMSLFSIFHLLTISQTAGLQGWQCLSFVPHWHQHGLPWDLVRDIHGPQVLLVAPPAGWNVISWVIYLKKNYWTDCCEIW